jgi:glycosyltransferase involved in cell wall biosynthesis
MASHVTPPIVTVLLPVYNGGRYLREAVESILSQTLQAFELLIVDDGSTDQTEAICRSFTDPRIRVNRHERNSGLVSALNDGIDQISTKYVARMDADDVALPSRLARQVAFLDSRPDIAACGSWARELVDGRLRDVMRRPTGEYLRRTAWRPVPIFHPTACLRAEVLHELRYRPDFIHAEDYDLWLRLCRRHRIDNVPAVLLHYRIHQASVGRTYRSTQLANSWRTFREHYPAIDVPFEDFETLMGVSCAASPFARMRLTWPWRRELFGTVTASARDDIWYATRWLRNLAQAVRRRRAEH